MSDDHKAVTDGNENRNRKQDGSHLSISIQQEWEHYKPGKNVPNAFNPHEGKTTWVVNRDSVSRRRADRVEYEVDAHTDYSDRNDQRKPKESRGSSEFACFQFHLRHLMSVIKTTSFAGYFLRRKRRRMRLKDWGSIPT